MGATQSRLRKLRPRRVIGSNRPRGRSPSPSPFCAVVCGVVVVVAAVWVTSGVIAFRWWIVVGVQRYAAAGCSLGGGADRGRAGRPRSGPAGMRGD
jgi:hypothetical protein